MRRGLGWVVVMVAWGLAACGSGGSSPVVNGDTDAVETPEQETESAPADTDAETQTPGPDGDLDSDADSEDVDLTDDDSELADTEENEFIPVEDDTEAADTDSDAVSTCPNGADALCFPGAPAGTSGTKCLRGDLVQGTPTQPMPPACTPSVCQWSRIESCAYGCEDAASDGHAACAPAPDGDETSDSDSDSADGDLDSDGDADSDSASDGDLDSEAESEAESETPVSTCLPDRAEPNQGFTQRYALGAGLYDDLTICGSDADYFAVSLFADSRLTLTFEQDPSGAPLTLYVYDAAYTRVAALDDTSTTNLVELSGTTAADYTVIVFSASMRDGAYSLQLTYDSTVDGDTDTDLDSDVDSEADSDADSEAPVCQDDANEPNETCATGTPIDLVAGTPFTLTGQTLCKNTVDWYRFYANAGDVITTDISFIYAAGNLNLEAYGPCDTFVTAVDTGNSTEHMAFYAPTSTIYGIRVAGPVAVRSTNYDITITRQSAQPCNDVFEPDDSAQGAAFPDTGSYTGLLMCRNEDWYGFLLGEGQALDLRVNFDPSLGDIALELYAADGTTLLAQSPAGRGTYDRIIYNSPTAQTVYARVYMPIPMEQSYDMAVSVVTGSLCQEDNFEENDNLAAAASLPAQSHDYDGLNLCGNLNEEDWYHLSLGLNWSVEADVLYDTSRTFFATLVDADSTIVANPTRFDGGSHLSFRSPGTGDYYLRFRKTGYQATSLPYDLHLNICQEDAYDNHTTQTATALASVANGALLRICPGTEDWFYTSLTPGQTATITANYTAAEGNLDLYLYDGNGQLLASSTNTDRADTIRYTATAITTVYAKVVGVGGVGNTYNLFHTVP